MNITIKEHGTISNIKTLTLLQLAFGVRGPTVCIAVYLADRAVGKDSSTLVAMYIPHTELY